MRGMVRLLVATVAVGSGLVRTGRGRRPQRRAIRGSSGRFKRSARLGRSPGGGRSPTGRVGMPSSTPCSTTCERITRPTATTDRVAALDTFTRSRGLGTVSWQPAANLREELRQWLRPRVRLAWARRRLSETVQALPADERSQRPGQPAALGRFVQNDLGHALRDYDAAATVAQRQAALHRIHESLSSLSTGNQSQPWWPSSELEAAVNDLFNRPNVDIAADADTVAPLFNATWSRPGLSSQGICFAGDRGPQDGLWSAAQRRRHRVL